MTSQMYAPYILRKSGYPKKGIDGIIYSDW